MFVLTEPTSSGCRGRAPAPRTAPSAGGLDRVADRGAGAVQLDVLDVGRGRSRPGRSAGAAPLPAPRAVGDGQPVAAAVVVDRAARG